MSRTRLLSLVPLLTLLVISQTVHADDADTAADVLAERMLQAIGGREAWAALRNTINGSRQNRVGEPTVVHAVITMDFEKPRFRIETTASDLHLIRVINGDNGWRLRRNANGRNYLVAVTIDP